MGKKKLIKIKISKFVRGLLKKDIFKFMSHRTHLSMDKILFKY